MLNRKALGLVLVAGATLSACAGNKTPIVSSADLTVLESLEMPTPERADALSAQRPFYIGPFDKLKVEVFGVSELERVLQVDANGNFTYPLIGNVAAGGSTLEEVAAQIAVKLRGRYVKDPQVTVNLAETQSQVVSVDGEVRKPGVFPTVGQMSLMRSVALAGGLTEGAGLDDVVVFRTVGGKRYAGLYNLGAIRRGVYADPNLFAGDVVIVGDSPSRKLFQRLLELSPILSTPLIIITQNL